MTEDQHITQAAAYAAVARSNGDEDREAYWTERAVRLSDQREAMQAQREKHERLMRAAVRELMTSPEVTPWARDLALSSLYASPGADRAVIDDERSKHEPSQRAAFDALKGSPDHSGLSAAEHAHIHSDAYTARLGPRLRNA